MTTTVNPKGESTSTSVAVCEEQLVFFNEVKPKLVLWLKMSGSEDEEDDHAEGDDYEEDDEEDAWLGSPTLDDDDLDFPEDEEMPELSPDQLRMLYMISKWLRSLLAWF